MTDLVFTAMPAKEAEAFRAGAADAYGNPPEKAVSPGGMPCRHCLRQIGEGDGMLILAYRPFPRYSLMRKRDRFFCMPRPVSAIPRHRLSRRCWTARITSCVVMEPMTASSTAPAR